MTLSGVVINPEKKAWKLWLRGSMFGSGVLVSSVTALHQRWVADPLDEAHLGNEKIPSAIVVVKYGDVALGVIPQTVVE
jgi:hypothetical protein